MGAYIAKRLAYMIVTLLMISVVSFVIIQLPPGDWLDSYVKRLMESGTHLDLAVLEGLRRQYALDQPILVQYFSWMSHILRGDFGFSFYYGQTVRAVIGERLALTVILSIATLLMSWLIAFPVGMLSAVRQHSMADYSATLIGYIGIAVPNFMIALIFVWLAYSWFGTSPGGLFSPEFVIAPWSVAKVFDMFKHLWIPAVIIGASGTAGLIRTLRANLLDELSKPYVVAARARGVPERKLFWKYPLRVAILPFISTVGWMLPAIVSGSTIVSVVLSLQTTGPVLLKSLLTQDMFLAGSFIMFLSVLTVIGTVVSDIMLAWVDPRIRLE